jgi:hypothetical protein
LSQDFKEVIGFELPAAQDGTPPQLFVENWIAWSPDGLYLNYIDPTVSRERFRVYDTRQLTQEIYRNIKGDQPDISLNGTVSAFMYDGKIWILPLDGSSIHSVAEGGWPQWIAG